MAFRLSLRNCLSCVDNCEDLSYTLLVFIRTSNFRAEAETCGGPQLSHQIQIPHIKIKFTTSNTNSPHQNQIYHIKQKFPTSNTNSPQQKQSRRCKIKLTTSKTNLSHQKRTCHSKNKWHVVFSGTPEHRTPEHRNITEHPKNPEHPQENPEHLPENQEHFRICL